MQKDKLKNVIEDWMDGTPFFLVDLKINSSNNIIVEFEAERGVVSIDDCVSLNNHIEDNFDRNVEDYSLEVGSAGIGQPFRVLKQYLKNIGNKVEVDTKTGKRIVGTLTDAGEAGFSIDTVKKVKPEGAKKPVSETVHMSFKNDQVNSVRYYLDFE